MIGLLVGMAAALLVLAGVIGYLAARLVNTQEELTDAYVSEHAKCIAHVADMTSKRVVAMAFRDAADRYGTVTEQAAIQRLVRTKWVEGGPSVPSLWMSEQADLIDPPIERPVLHTLNGDRV